MNGWRLVPTRHSEHVSNVSALVVPERMPVADHEQLPMFGQDPAEFARLVSEAAATARVQSETARAQTEATLTIAALLRELLNRTRGRARQPSAPAAPAEAPPAASEFATQPRAYGPSNPRHRTWRGFVLDMQRQVRELPSGRPTKVNVEMHGGDTVRSISYTMRGYGLDPGEWPPDSWDPDEDRTWHPPKRP
jgi:hypothetical protein